MNYNAIEAIAASMKAFPKNQRIASNGLRAIINMSSKDPDRVGDQFLDNNIIELAATAMKLQFEDEEVVYLSTFALGSVPSTNLEIVAEKLVESGGVPLVIRGMKSFPSNESLQAEGCKTLSYFTSSFLSLADSQISRIGRYQKS